MTVLRALLSTPCFFSLLGAFAAAESICDPKIHKCPVPYPPGHQAIGNAWFAIGSTDTESYITHLTTTLEVPPRPDNDESYRVINSPLDNSVSIDFCGDHVE